MNQDPSSSNRDLDVLPTEAPLQTANRDKDFSVGGMEVMSPNQLKALKISDSAQNFFRLMYVNLVFTSVVLLGLLTVVNRWVPIRFMVLAMTPVDLLIVAQKLVSTSRDKNIRSKRQLVTKIVFSSQLLDSTARCISCLVFFAVRYVEGFFYTLCLGPILVTSVAIIAKNSCIANKVIMGKSPRAKEKPLGKSS